MKKSFFQLQHDQSDCGVACLANIIRHHGGDASLETLRNLSGTSQQGTTLLGLLQAAKQSGFDAEGMEAEGIHHLKELKDPVILHVTLEGRLQHYIVYYPERGKSGAVTIGDPAKGIMQVNSLELSEWWKSKVLLLLTPNDQFQKSALVASRKRKWVMDLLREDFPVLGISLVLGVIIAVLGIATAVFSQRLMDDILPKENIQKLLLSTLLVTCLLVARSGFNYLRGILMVYQGKAFNNRVIRDFYASLLKLPKSFFDTRKTGELVARMSDTRRIQSVISILTGSAVIDLLLVMVSTGFVMFYSWWIGGILLACIGAYLLIVWKFNQPISVAQKQVMAGYAFAESNFMDSMQGITEVKLTGKESMFEKINQGIYEQFQERMASLGKLNSRFGLVSEITGVVFIMLVFGLSSSLVIMKKLSIGELVALLGMAGNMVPSLTRLVVANIQIQEARVVFDRMFEFTSMEKEVMQGGKSLDHVDALHLQLQNVSFRFPGRRQILSDVSFELKTGEMVGVVGESGRGKSTLLQLIQKFYAPESGTIRVNGIDLQECATESWRSMLGCVSQEVKIFNNSLLFNITLSDEVTIHERAIAFCEQAGLGTYFRHLPQAYLTVVGEEGVNLSGGQKQLVALARALFRNPKLLVLDEATSAMDSNLEMFVLDLLQKNKHRMAILMVTHRRSTSLQCDRVVMC